MLASTLGKAVARTAGAVLVPNLPSGPTVATYDDDFSGSGFNSGSVGDTNYNNRWFQVEGTTPSIVSQELQIIGNGGGISRIQTYATGLLDGFTIKVDWRQIGSFGGGTNTITLRIVGPNYLWQVDSDTNALDWFNGSFNTVPLQASGNFELRRDPSSSTIKFLLDGVQKGTGTNSATVTAVQLYVWNSAITGAFDNFIINDNANGDGTGNAIPIP